MMWVILVLLVLAAIFGILGMVVKAVAFVVLTITLTVVVLIAVAWYALKHQARKLSHDVDARMAERRATEFYGDDDGGELPPPRDDRY
jgi:uncharacterized protein (DUF58 family)